MQDRLPSRRLDHACKALEAVARGGPISLANIAHRTGLSPEAASEAMEPMRMQGWLRESGRTASSTHRDSPGYEIVPEAASIAVVDLGGTNVRAAISDLTGRLPSQVRESTDHRGGIHAVRQVARLCRSAAEQEGIPFQQRSRRGGRRARRTRTRDRFACGWHRIFTGWMHSTCARGPAGRAGC